MIRTGTLAILPAGATEYLQRRLCDVGAFALFGGGVALFLALASFDPSDPSFNHATQAEPLNLLGRPGANVADILLSGFGWAGFVPVLGFFGWGWRLLGKRPMRRLALQGLALIAAVALLSIALAALPMPAGWPIGSGPGGFAGRMLLTWAAAASASVTVFAQSLIVICALVLGCLALGLGMGVSMADWRMFARTLGDGVARLRAAVRFLFSAIDRVRSMTLRDTHIGATGKAAAGAKIDRTRRTDFAKEDIVDARTLRVKVSRRVDEQAQGALDLEPSTTYGLPSLDLLKVPAPPPNREVINRVALEQNAELLKTVLDDFGVRGEILKVRPGPVITLYELEPAPGTKTARVIALADDIARSMSAVSARVAVVPGRNAIGIELPNQRRETVGLRELLASDALERSAGALMLALGKDIGGSPVIVDLARMPHLLIAGTTGSGKSVAINVMILSLLYRLSPEACKLILIDPKMLELSVYDGIPHLLSPVVTEAAKAVVALKWTVREMEERYRSMSQLGVRNIAGFNSRIAEARAKGETLKRRVQTGFDDDGKPKFEELELDLAPLPLIVVVVDEMADLMLVAGKDIEAAVQRLSQLARAAGIHLIMATQRPSVDVITGTIKANFPTRISFQVTSKIDSRTILGEQGAEQLLGQGDMLFMAPGGRVTRVHGPFVSDSEVEAVVKSLKAQGEPHYIEAVTEAEDEDVTGAESMDDGNERDELYDEAVSIVLRDGKASTSFVQRRLQIGYNRAARLVERMEAEGLVSKADRVGRREVLVGERAV
jgi:DNA segregation ATPase FtsK/SpoIIIE, S-DNA-T family